MELVALFIKHGDRLPKKFHDFLHSKDLSGKLIRSKGYFWLATRPQFCWKLSQAGGIAHHGFAGMFLEGHSKEPMAN